MDLYNTTNSIKCWSEDDRPREKLILKGKSTLSDAELLANIISSGSSNMSAVDLSKHILSNCGNSFEVLAQMQLDDLMKFPGIGEAKAVSIVSALEIGRRRRESTISSKPSISCSADAYELMKPELLDLPHEEFWILTLKRNNEVISKDRLSKGGVSGTVVDPKTLFKLSISKLSSGIILIHNHPSGNLKPSQADINLTRKIREGGKLLEVSILDHIIFTNSGYFSFADEGLL